LKHEELASRGIVVLVVQKVKAFPFSEIIQALLSIVRARSHQGFENMNPVPTQALLSDRVRLVRNVRIQGLDQDVCARAVRGPTEELE
jgi:hypothetical protein